MLDSHKVVVCFLMGLSACASDPEPDRISLEFSKLRRNDLQREGARLEAEITRSERRIAQLNAELRKRLDEEAVLGAELKALRLHLVELEAELVERRLAEEALRQSGGGGTEPLN